MTSPERLTAALAGRYQIEREIGAGGMATVYLARDLRHDRNVAVKVLRPELALVVGADRFVQEIKTTASLQHPNILPLFDSGGADGFLFYVMPFVEGETLRSRLDRERQLSVADAVRIASEVAEALEHAHTQGIVHRDIKPENILLRDGRPLVADFGIALALSAAAADRKTETGLSLGTPHYMSPEQAAADKRITHRTDIYSLGAVLYEMLTGEPPHSGISAQQIILKIVTDTPQSVSALRSSVPVNVEAAVATALAQVPADRFPSARRFAEALADPSYAGAGPRPPRAAARWRWAVPTLAAAWLATASIAVVGWLRERAPEGTLTRYRLSLAEDQRLVSGFGTSIAVSPDGSRIVYLGPAKDGVQLWLRERASTDASPIPGTEGAAQPFFAPDGRSVAFVGLDRSLKVVSLTGAPVRTLVDDGLYRLGGAWGPDDWIYYSTPTGLARIPATGGSPESITVMDPDQPEVLSHGWPEVLPSGRAALFTISRNHVPSQIAAIDLVTGERHVLAEGLLARYAATGHLVYARGEGALMAVRFDEARLEARGTAVQLDDRLPSGITPNLAISASGRLVYGSSPERTLEVVRVERDGAWAPIDSANRVLGVRYVALSPSGQQLAVTVWNRPPSDEGHIWIKDLTTGAFTPLTFEGSVNMRPAWTSDGRFVTFISDRGGSRDVWIKRADGTREAELLVAHASDIDEAVPSSDGAWVIHRRGMQEGDRDIYGLPRRPGADPVPLLTSRFNETSPALSPDGRWLAYVSDRTGRSNVFVRPFPGLDTEVQVSPRGGTQPVWSPNGRELFYRSGSGHLMAVEVPVGRSFRTARQQRLFPMTPYRDDAYHAAYDVEPDGSAFIMIRESDQGTLEQELVVVEHWHQELRGKLRP